VSNNRLHHQWTPVDADGRLFPGQACRRAGSPHRYLASGRRGHPRCPGASSMMSARVRGPVPCAWSTVACTARALPCGRCLVGLAFAHPQRRLIRAPPVSRGIALGCSLGCSSAPAASFTADQSRTLVQLELIGTTQPRAANAVGFTAPAEVSSGVLGTGQMKTVGPLAGH
jgi:hypothetical protein